MEFLAQSDGGGGSTIFWILYAVFIVAYLVGGWMMYEKAGQAGWKVLIPFYNVYILLKIVGRPGWWLILYLIPIVNIVILVIVSIDQAKSFGHGVGFALGLIFLAPIFWMILGFGPSRYLGPAGPEGASGGGAAAPPAMPPAPA